LFWIFVKKNNEKSASISSKAKVDELAALNSAIVKAESDYSTAVNDRNEIYNGEAGINSIVPSILPFVMRFIIGYLHDNKLSISFDYDFE